MNKELNKIFWGLVIISLDFNLRFVNILPDFLGYIIIYSGLSNSYKIELLFFVKEDINLIIKSQLIKKSNWLKF